MTHKIKSLIVASSLLLFTAASFKYGGIKHDITVTAKALGTTTLTASSTQVQAFTGTNTQTVDLPSGLTLKNGYWYTISNEGTAGAISVRDASASIIKSVAASASSTFYMKNSAVIGGNWSVDSGSGSGSGSGGGGDMRVFNVWFSDVDADTTACNDATCTIRQQHDDEGNTDTVSSVSRDGVGNYDVNITASRCSQPPMCSVHNRGSTTGLVTRIRSNPTTSLIEIGFANDASGATDAVGFVTCMCLR